MRAFGVDAAETRAGYAVEGGGRYRAPSAPYETEGDASQEAFWHLANYLGSRVSLAAPARSGLQGDAVFPALLAQLAAAPAGGRAPEFDVSQIPDLVPALAAVPRAIRLLEALAPEEPAVLGLSAPAGSFLLGACLFALAFVAVRIPAIAYVAVHETTHALFGLLSGARVTRLRVAEEEGSVDVSRPNALNLLAPYFFPLPCVTLLLLFGLVSLAVGMVGTPAGSVAAGICGAAWGFHLCFTVNALLQRQTDLDAYGFLFSFVLVLLLNELFLFFAFVALSPARLGPSLDTLLDLSSGSYGWFLDLAFEAF